jgi:ATP-dependent DNA helicase RecG
LSNELILSGKNLTYDEMQVNDIDLDLNELSYRLKKVLEISEVDKNVLTSLGLYKNSKYNIAAKLLSDNNNIGKISLLRYSDSVETIKDRIDLENISVLKQFDRCIDFYYKHINRREEIRGAYRKTIESVPLVAYREAVANAICHRDYNKEADIKIEIFDDKVEVTSPGTLPIGISYEDFIDGTISIPRNKIIAEIFYRLKLIEKIATGIRRIKSHYREYNLKPEFLVTANSVRIVLPNVLYRKEIILSDREKEIINLFKDDEFLAAKDISKALAIKKTQTSKYLNELVSKGLITKIGNSRSVKYIITNTRYL